VLRHLVGIGVPPRKWSEIFDCSFSDQGSVVGTVQPPGAGLVVQYLPHLRHPDGVRHRPLPRRRVGTGCIRTVHSTDGRSPCPPASRRRRRDEANEHHPPRSRSLRQKACRGTLLPLRASACRKFLRPVATSRRRRRTGSTRPRRNIATAPSVHRSPRSAGGWSFRMIISVLHRCAPYYLWVNLALPPSKYRAR
jgi:hypothetical protein